jgi:uncharacterized protein YecE (DUF72 family)
MSETTRGTVLRINGLRSCPAFRLNPGVHGWDAADGGASGPGAGRGTSHGERHVTIRAGTSGYSYKEWKGAFYPEDLAADAMLAHYGSRLPAVEINNTFYRLPKEKVLESWCAQVPDSFRFAIKASRRITHIRRLKGAESEMQFLLGNLQTMGARLGAILFQLPPNMKADLPRLEAFLELLPPRAPAAFEFRNLSWFADDVFDCLKRRGCALVHVDAHEGDVERTPAPLTTTADWGYLRLRREDYDEAAIAAWRERIAAQPWRESFAFFKHETLGPQFAEMLNAGPRDASPSPAKRAKRKS